MPACHRDPSLKRRKRPDAPRGIKETALKLVTSAAAIMTLTLSTAVEPSQAQIISRAMRDDFVAWGCLSRTGCSLILSSIVDNS